MENEFIELVFPVVLDSNEVPVFCLIRYLAACGFAWSDIWLRLHLCLLIRSCSKSYVGYKAKFLGFDHEKRVLSGFFYHEKRVQKAAKYLIKQDFVNQAPQGKRVQRKTSSMNLFSIHGNRVQWTRFPYMETKFFELDFCVLSHVTSLVNWFLWIRIVINEISLKLCLTYNIV